MKYEEVWAHALEQIKQIISKPSFETWLKPTDAIEFCEGVLTITAPNEFACDWVEARYTELIQQILKNITSENISIKVVSRNENTTINPLPNEYDFTKVEHSRSETTEIKDLLFHMEERINDRLNDIVKRIERLETKLER